MEYQCFYLNTKSKLAHDDNAVILFESDHLHECAGFIYHKFQEEGLDIAVYQPRSKGYREYYRKPARDSLGRFTKR